MSKFLGGVEAACTCGSLAAPPARASCLLFQQCYNMHGRLKRQSGRALKVFELAPNRIPILFYFEPAGAAAWPRHCWMPVRGWLHGAAETACGCMWSKLMMPQCNCTGEGAANAKAAEQLHWCTCAVCLGRSNLPWLVAVWAEGLLCLAVRLKGFPTPFPLAGPAALPWPRCCTARPVMQYNILYCTAGAAAIRRYGGTLTGCPAAPCCSGNPSGPRSAGLCRQGAGALP